jgi:hypothetical protein
MEAAQLTNKWKIPAIGEVVQSRNALKGVGQCHIEVFYLHRLASAATSKSNQSVDEKVRERARPVSLSATRAI